MKTIRKSQKYKQRKSTTKKTRVPPLSSILTNQVSGAKTRSYLINYSKFINAYKYYYPNRDFDLVRSFLIASDPHVLKQIDDDLKNYLNKDWHDESCMAFLVYIIEEHLVNFMSPKINTLSDYSFKSFYVSDDLLEWLERFVVYHYYVEGWSLAKIEKACLSSKTLRYNYLKQAVSKLRKAC